MNNNIEEENLEGYPENLKYGTAFSEESVKKKWLEKLNSNFTKQLQRFKEGPADKHGWVLPNSALELFDAYFSEYEKTIREKHKNNPTETVSMIDEDTGEKYLVERDRADPELFPLVYEIMGGGILYLPIPEIPNEFLFEKIRIENTLLGLVPNQEQSAEKNILQLIPSKKEEKGVTASVKYLLLDHFFSPKENFKNLLIKDQEQALRFIIGVGVDSIGDIRNNANNARKKITSKAIAEPSINRFFELLEKIEKGKL